MTISITGDLVKVQLDTPDWLKPGCRMLKADYDRLVKLHTWHQIAGAQRTMTIIDAKRWICIELCQPAPRPKFIKRLWQAFETLRKKEEVAQLATLFPGLKARSWVAGLCAKKR
jgi:hypothetical protein